MDNKTGVIYILTNLSFPDYERLYTISIRR